jgi:hypothetical protein
MLEAVYRPPPPSEHPELSLNDSDFSMEPAPPDNSRFDGWSGASFRSDLPSRTSFSQDLERERVSSNTTEISSFQHIYTSQNTNQVPAQNSDLSIDLGFLDQSLEIDPDFFDLDQFISDLQGKTGPSAPTLNNDQSSTNEA